jgi:hypothetical protein
MVKWTSAGDGYFSEPDALNTEYKLGMNDKMQESLFLQLTAYPATPCLPISSSRRVVIDTCASLNELAGVLAVVRLYPNPAHGHLNIEIDGLSDKSVTMTLSTVLNEILLTETIACPTPTLSHRLDVASLSAGSYFLTIHTTAGMMVRPFLVY